MDTEGQILYDPTHMRYSEPENQRSRRSRHYWGLQGVGKGELVFNGYRVYVWDDKKPSGAGSGYTTLQM